MKRSMHLLPQIDLSILIALSLKPRHGYEIMKQVQEDSLGKIKLGPGSLYTAIKQLLDEKLIEDAPSTDARRKYYQLSDAGRQRLTAELAYFDTTIRLAKQRNVYELSFGASSYAAQ